MPEKNNGSALNEGGFPLWLLAELTYKCPLQCPYCSNPLDFAKVREELNTSEWIEVFKQARRLGSVQLGFSGGEPLMRKDLEELVSAGQKLGFYTNLITSGLGMDERRIDSLKEAGLDHIQISFQADSQELNDLISGSKRSFEKKQAMAKAVKQAGYPMILNFVIHRYNVDRVDVLLEMAHELGADEVELANSQYHGWALKNRNALLPDAKSLEKAKEVTDIYREKYKEMKIYFIVPDYYANRPKPCMGGWAKNFLVVVPDGTALPCHNARILPLEFPNVKEMPLHSIWKDSEAFNLYRGNSWMKSPCKTCPEKHQDFGGCRCQAYFMTGDARNADPVCDKSPHRFLIDQAIQDAGGTNTAFKELIYRTPKNSKVFSS